MKTSKKAIKLPVTINLGTGKESARHIAFSQLGWNEPTTNYLVSINKVISKTDMDEIIAQTKEFHNMTTEPEDVGCSIDVDDERCNIVEGSGSSESGDSDQDDDEDSD